MDKPSVLHNAAMPVHAKDSICSGIAKKVRNRCSSVFGKLLIEREFSLSQLHGLDVVQSSECLHLCA